MVARCAVGTPGGADAASSSRTVTSVPREPNASATDALTRRYGGDLGTDLDDASAQLAPQNTRVDHAQRKQDVPEIQSRGVHGNANLTRLERAVRHFRHPQPFEGAVWVRLQEPARAVGQCQPPRARRVRREQAGPPGGAPNGRQGGFQRQDT